MRNSFSHRRIIIIAIALLLMSTAIPYFTGSSSRAAAVSAPHQNNTAPSRGAGAAITEDTRRAVNAAYSKLPLSFETNGGQTDPAVRFVSRAEGSTVFLTPTGAVLTLQPSHKQPDGSAHEHPSRTSATAIRMNLIGADPAVEIVGHDRLPGNSH